MYIIVGNFGNQSIALIQWAIEQKLKSIYVVSVETGWGSKKWQKRVGEAENYAKNHGFTVKRLQAQPTFSDLVHERRIFPSQKFQWCVTFLKGLPLNEWLDKIDPSCQTTILLGKRRLDSRANVDLPEFLEASEHFGQRKVWYPLVNCSDRKFINLIRRSGFSLLTHRSLECEPCIHSRGNDLSRLDPSNITKTKNLENELNVTMFNQDIETMVADAKLNRVSIKEMFTMGCGSPFGCGE
jgi:3'-phosphoadenosine 5'-phosphosulfate sulfotransferase (PAPS reductase)/FAD synthetase